MRIRLVTLLSLVCFSISSLALSLTKKELDQKYAYNEAIQWEKRLKTKLNPTVKNYLDHGQFQEAIWLLEENNDEKSADYLKNFLREIMEHAPFQPDGIIGLGGGVTETKLVYLTHGVRAVFKEKSSHPSSDYKSEVGAYLVDQIGKFALVPMTIVRHHDNKFGSLQYFVGGTKDTTSVENFKKSPKLNVFDYLVRNQDRTSRNILLLGDREVAIDHGLALRPGSVLGDFLRITDKARLALGIRGDAVRMKFVFPSGHASDFRAQKRILSALRDLTYSEMVSALYPILSTDRIKMVWKKNVKLLKVLDKTSDI